MRKEVPEIKCRTFQKEEPIIKNVTDKINSVAGIREKAKFAGELQKEVGVLLSCPDYDEKNSDCEKCRFIANMRSKTAGLIMKAKKLA